MPKPSVATPAGSKAPKASGAHESTGRRQRVAATRRILIAHVQPHISDSRRIVRRIVGDAVPISAEVLCDGKAILRACIQYRPPGESRWRPAPLQHDIHADGADPCTWRGVLRLQHGGRTQFCIEAWVDVFATWVDAVRRAFAVDDTASMAPDLIEDGRRILDQALTRASGADLALLAECRETLQEHADSLSSWERWLRNRELHKRMLVHGERRHVVRSEPIRTIEALRRRAVFVTHCRIDQTEPFDSEAVRDLQQVGVEVLHGLAGRRWKNKPVGVDEAADLLWPEATEEDWHRQHPEWFRGTRLTGTQMSWHLDFWCEARDALWDACLASLQARARQGISVFVASRATAVPFPFWEWAIRRVRQLHPEVLFLASATSEAQARGLAHVGFSQVQVRWQTLADAADGVETLQDWNAEEWCACIEVPGSGDGGVARQARHLMQLLGATSSSCFGIRCLPQDRSDVQWLRMLNQWRRDNRALQIHGNLRLLPVESNDVVALHRGASQGRNDIVVVVNRHPQNTIETQVSLHDLRHRIRDGVADGTILFEDLLDGQRLHWKLGDNYVRFGPGHRQAHVLRVVRPSSLFG